MTIRWMRIVRRGAVAGLLLLFVYWVPTWRPQVEYAFVFRAIGTVCASCNALPDDAVVALMERSWSHQYTCLMIEGQDPTPALLVRVQSIDERIVPASQCTRTDLTGYRTPDDTQVLLLFLHDWQRTSLTRATVSIGRSPGYILGGSGSVCELRRLGDGWVVEGCRMTWIS